MHCLRLFGSCLFWVSDSNRPDTANQHLQESSNGSPYISIMTYTVYLQWLYFQLVCFYTQDNNSMIHTLHYMAPWQILAGHLYVSHINDIILICVGQVLQCCSGLPNVISLLYNSYLSLQIYSKWRKDIPDDVFQVRLSNV